MQLNQSFSCGRNKSWNFFFEIIECFVGGVPVDWLDRVIDDVEVVIHALVLGEYDGLLLYWSSQDHSWVL